MKEIFIVTIFKKYIVAFHQISQTFKEYSSTLKYLKEEINKGKTPFMKKYFDVKVNIEGMKEAMHGKLNLLIIIVDKKNFSNIDDLIDVVANYKGDEYYECYD